MNNALFCTIIIPIYQVERYIGKCLKSVMAQSFTKGVECILVNDCTKDESVRIAQKIIDEYRGEIPFHIIGLKMADFPRLAIQVFCKRGVTTCISWIVMTI